MLRVGVTAFLLFLVIQATAQVFLPMAFWRPKMQVALRCEAGCYPTPTTPFTAATYYIPINYTATFKAISSSNPSAFDFCFGPNGTPCAANAISDQIYPLTCNGPGNGSIDGNAVADEADYTAPASVTTDTCYVTDYNETQAQATANIQSFNPVTITSPITSSGSPQNVCVNQTQVINATGGLGTLNWSVILGAGSVSPLTGGSTTYTAPAAPSTVQVQVIDSTTSMPAIAYLNVVNTIELTPTASTLETPVNSPTFMHYPGTTGVSYVANLNFQANCGLQTYSVSCVGGGSVLPTAGVNNLQNVTFTPATVNSTSTITFTDSSTPTAQTASRTVKSIVPVDISSASGGAHFCVRYSHSSYPAGNFKVKCWGYNNRGQLGYGDVNNRGDAATELGYGLALVNLGTNKYVKKISAGWFHTCAILDDDQVKCWGDNTYGQLGYGDVVHRGDGANEMGDNLVNVNLGTGRTVKEIYAFAYRSCAILDNDVLKCWGRNNSGQLGYEDIIQRGDGINEMGDNLPAVSLGTGRYAVQVAGAEFATCAILDNGTLKCWGSNSNSQLGLELGTGTVLGNGLGEMGDNLANVNLNMGANTVTKIAGGWRHFCALISNGDVKCWGEAQRGQLGKDGTNDLGESAGEMSGLTAINLGTTAIDIATMRESSCAILTGGNAKCWGRNRTGQLLRGNTTDMGDNGGEMASVGNMNFGTGRTVKKIATAYYQGCAILDNDFIKCWGTQACNTTSNTSTTNNGCLMSGYSPTDNSGSTAAPNMMRSHHIGDNGSELGDSLPYVNH